MIFCSFLLITAFPKPAPDMRTLYIAVVGENVNLSCGVGPGRLSTHYRTHWRRVTRDIILVINTDIDPATFSLALADVVQDHAGTYQCIVTVENPGLPPYNVPVQDIILVVYGELQYISI